MTHAASSHPMQLRWPPRKKGPQNDVRHALKHFVGRPEEDWRDLLTTPDQDRWDAWHTDLRRSGCDSEDHSGRCPDYARCKEIGTDAAPLYTALAEASFRRAAGVGLCIAFHYEQAGRPVVNSVDGAGIYVGAFGRYQGHAGRRQVDASTVDAGTVYRPPGVPRDRQAIGRLPEPRRRRAATWQHTLDALVELHHFAQNRSCVQFPQASRAELGLLLRWWRLIQADYVDGRPLPAPPPQVAHLAGALDPAQGAP